MLKEWLTYQTRSTHAHALKMRVSYEDMREEKMSLVF